MGPGLWGQDVTKGWGLRLWGKDVTEGCGLGYGGRMSLRGGAWAMGEGCH